MRPAQGIRLLRVLLPTLLAACAPGPRPAADLDAPPPLGLKLRLASLDLKDLRKDLGPVEDPSLSRRGGFAVAKTLEAEDTAALRSQVERDFTGTGFPVHLEVALEAAEVGWHGRGVRNVTEQGRFRVRIAFSHGSARLAECSGAATLERPNTHATRDSLRRLFRDGLAVSVHQCLETTREELKKSPRAPGAAPI